MKSEIFRKSFWLQGLAILIGLGMQQANASPYTPTASEMAALPPFCKAKLGADPANVKLYSDRIGPDWLHIHHYCFGLGFANKYYRDYGNRMARADDLKQAVTNYDYVLEHAAPGFWMRAEIGTQKARILAAAKRNAEAIGALDVALQADHDYAPAYAELSDIYRDLGQQAKALSSVERGLQHVPLDMPLQRRYKKLAGKDFVVPAGAEAAANKKSPDTASAVSEDSTAEAAAKSETETVPAPDKIGVPGNPYCRFCP
ncbi:MAG: tetratricopeptide repeat protein [Sulfuriferula sp.]